MRSGLALALALLGACAIPALAHHSFAATYFEDKVVTIEGDLVQFQFRNPHSFVDVAVKEANGEVTRWAVEWGGGGQLSREGVNRETLKPGDHVIVSGNPGRNAADHRIRMQSIKRPKDGWGWKGVVQ